MSRHRSLVLAIIVVASAACSQGAVSTDTAKAELTDSAGGLVIAPTGAYNESGSGPSALLVTLAGESGASTTSAPGCGAESSASESVFWIDGIRSGKPLPQDRRYEMASSACGIEPSMLAVVVGGTINVFNADVAHHLTFVRSGTADTLQTMPFSEPKSMVATERLTKTAGMIEVRCSLHPQERAYIAVFDHPYFGVGSAGEKISIDSLPAGEYKVLTWHDGMLTPAVAQTKVVGGQNQLVLK